MILSKTVCDNFHEVTFIRKALIKKKSESYRNIERDKMFSQCQLLRTLVSFTFNSVFATPSNGVKKFC